MTQTSSVKERLAKGRVSTVRTTLSTELSLLPPSLFDSLEINYITSHRPHTSSEGFVQTLARDSSHPRSNPPFLSPLPDSYSQIDCSQSYSGHHETGTHRKNQHKQRPLLLDGSTKPVTPDKPCFGDRRHQSKTDPTTGNHHQMSEFGHNMSLAARIPISDRP